MPLKHGRSRRINVGRVVAWLVAVAIGGYAFMPICDLHFNCGCDWPGLGGHAHCDILQSGPPDCPWCYHTWLGYGVMTVSAALGFVGVLLSPPRWSAFVVALLSTAFVIGGLVLTGVLTSVWLGHPVLAGL